MTDFKTKSQYEMEELRGRIRRTHRSTTHGDYICTWKGSQVHLKGLRMGRPPNTINEVKLGWEGIVKWGSYFNGDTASIAAHLGLSPHTPSVYVNRGFMPVWCALHSEKLCPDAPWMAEELIPYLKNPVHWQLWRRDFPSVMHGIELRREVK